MYIHQTQIRVRYGETDQMGYLHHGNYALYYEQARTDALRALGTTYQQMEAEHGVLMPVMSLNMRFVRPATYDELLIVQTCLRKLPDQYITFYMEVLNENGKLVNGGAVKLCFLDAQSRRSISAPDYLIRKLQPFFEN